MFVEFRYGWVDSFPLSCVRSGRQGVISQEIEVAESQPPAAQGWHSLGEGRRWLVHAAAQCNSPEDYFWLLLSKSCKKHKGSLLFLTSGFYCSRWGKFPSQDYLMNIVGDTHPSRASACCFSICKLYIFNCLQQREYTYSLLSPYGSIEIRCTVRPHISFKNSHSCTEKAICRISVN